MLCIGLSHNSYINVTFLLISGKRDHNILIEDENKPQVLINSQVIVLFTLVPYLYYSLTSKPIGKRSSTSLDNKI